MNYRHCRDPSYHLLVLPLFEVVVVVVVVVVVLVVVVVVVDVVVGGSPVAIV